MAIVTDLMKYFEDHPGVNIYADDLANELKMDRRTLTTSIAWIIREDKLPGLCKLAKPGPYVYKPNNKKAASSTTYYELLAVTKKGELVIQSEDGTLYKAVEL